MLAGIHPPMNDHEFAAAMQARSSKFKPAANLNKTVLKSRETPVEAATRAHVLAHRKAVKAEERHTAAVAKRGAVIESTVHATRISVSGIAALASAGPISFRMDGVCSTSPAPAAPGARSSSLEYKAAEAKAQVGHRCPAAAALPVCVCACDSRPLCGCSSCWMAPL